MQASPPVAKLAAIIQRKMRDGASAENAIAYVIAECVETHLALGQCHSLPWGALRFVAGTRFLARHSLDPTAGRRTVTPAQCDCAAVVRAVLPQLIEPVRARGVGANVKLLWAMLVMFGGGMKAPQIGRALWAGAPMAEHSGNRNHVHTLRRDVLRSIAVKLRPSLNDLTA